MDRHNVAELLEDPSLPEAVVAESYRDLERVHRWLGNTRAILSRLRSGFRGGSINSVLDIGCGQGALLQEIRRRLGVQVTGFDLRMAPETSPVRILMGNAVVDPRPERTSH